MSESPNVTMSTTDGVVLTERRGEHLLIIRLNRPERRNAIDPYTAGVLRDTFAAYDADDSLRCAILTGSDVVFSSGADLIAARERAMSPGEKPRRGGSFTRRAPGKPLIAAVEGYALAGGLELCLACDLIVASRTALMGIPEVARSLVAIGGGCFRLPKRIPYHLAMELALTGKPWPATRMAEIGLVNRLAPPGRALDVAVELAQEILAAGPLAVRATKQIVTQAFEWHEDDAWTNQMEYVAPVFASEDRLEGLHAFAEKRPPVWKGC
jgi:enoyl-CoA hydratase